MGKTNNAPEIVRAAIYPAIGIARVGNSPTEFFIGPEVATPERKPGSFYKDPKGALKRQAARFRIYGLDAKGQVVKELTAEDAKITWRVTVANKKAAWYEFNVAMDIPQATPTPLRNPNITDRTQLMITPPEVKISGPNQSGKGYAFDKGKFMGTPVYLGELMTDDKGRLLFLGGHGLSRSAYPNNPPTTFANNEGWHDDTSDGPVDADVVYNGKPLQVEGAWVVTAPPNYAPDMISILTMYDVIFDTLNGMYVKAPAKPSFMNDIYPLLHQFVDMQWVNKGFMTSFGKGQAYDFEDAEYIRRLSTVTANGDQFQEYRRQIFNYFRAPNTKEMSAALWPWMYGDNMNVPNTTPNGYLWVTKTIYGYLKQWVAGDFVQDWNPNAVPPKKLEDLKSPQEQADSLTKTALWYCLGGPFHPGCEMTWPMRLPGMYTGPFRIRRRSANNPEPTLPAELSPSDFQNSNFFTTPLPEFWHGPGDVTKYMATPWQTDTASCRAGYETSFDPYIPTFWPARVPNTVLTKADYEIVVDPNKTRQERLDAYNRRASWYRILGANYLNQIANMVERYGDLGVVGYEPGPQNDPDFPAAMYVESVPFANGQQPAVSAKKALAAAPVDALRQALIDEAASVPLDQGTVVGAVGKGALRNR